MAKICQCDCVKVDVERGRASIGANKITCARMSTSEAKNIARFVIPGKKRNARTADSRMSDQFLAVVHRTVERNFVQLAVGNVHFSREERVATTVQN